MPHQPWKVSDQARENVQICIRCAERRVKGATWKDIAIAEGLDSPMAAKKCIDVGLQLIPSEDVRSVRRMAAMRLDKVIETAFRIVDNPGMRTTVSGKLVLDPATGQPMPDEAIRNAALKTILDADVQYRKLFGADAPKQSVNFLAALSSDELRAIVEQKRAERLAIQREREMHPVIAGALEPAAALNGHSRTDG